MRPTKSSILCTDATAEAANPPITLVVCTNRLARYISNIEANARLRSPGDHFLCIVDEDGPSCVEILQRLHALSIDVSISNKNEGLSHSRNKALRLCQTQHVLFLDDDVTLTKLGLAALRNAASAGATVAGLRLTPPASLRLDRWFITFCQWHYLALHRPDRPASVWGACMLVDADAARRSGLAFQANLGRKGTQLQSGDDTTFIRRLHQHSVVAIDEPCATHHVANNRLRFRYLLRRAYWQGVSEYRRRSAIAGLAKEAKRNLDFDLLSVRRLALATTFIAVVACGVIAAWVRHFVEPTDE
jgi:glycosyltransferase involved in cell wall biosynthesis